MQCLCVSKENNQYIYNEKYRPTKHRTSCDVTIADAHIAISMLKRYIVQPYFTLLIGADVTTRGLWIKAYTVWERPLEAEITDTACCLFRDVILRWTERETSDADLILPRHIVFH